MVRQIKNEIIWENEPKRSNTYEAKAFGFLSNVHNRISHSGNKMVAAIEITRQNGLGAEQEINRAAYFLQRTAHAP